MKRSKQLRMTVQAAQERRSQIELELVRKQAELKYPGRDQPQGTEHSGRRNWPRAKRPCWTKPGSIEAEQKYQEVKARIEALGPVNPQALEEFQEAQQRYDFLNAQRQDLLDSIRDTEKAIHDIDVESRKRFTDAFEAVNGHFREMFRTLFGGGIGEMRLTDETNIAESGIDIVASPPGKRLQNVLLLSGGEKSLTAMALLMAIFHYTPSPFCILDEVDAPLDEPNIERLTRLIKEMSDADAVHRDHARQADHGSGAVALWRHHAGAGRVEAGVGPFRAESRRRAASQARRTTGDARHGELTLFRSQRGDRVDARNAPGRQPDRQKRDGAQDRGSQREYQRVPRFHSEKKTVQKPRQPERRSHADGDSDGGQAHALRHHHVSNARRFGAQRQANPDFLSALRHRVSHQSINANGGQKDSGASEDRHQQRVEIAAGAGFGHHFVQRADGGHWQAAAGLLELVLNGGAELAGSAVRAHDPHQR